MGAAWHRQGAPGELLVVVLGHEEGSRAGWRQGWALPCPALLPLGTLGHLPAAVAVPSPRAATAGRALGSRRENLSRHLPLCLLP